MSTARHCEVKACPSFGAPCDFHDQAVYPRGFNELDRMVRERPHHGGDRLDDQEDAA